MIWKNFQINENVVNLTNDSSFSNVSPIDQLDQQLKLERQKQEEMKKQEESLQKNIRQFYVYMLR